MNPRRSIALAIAFCALLTGGPAIAQPDCRPAITIKEVRFSEMIKLKRFWTAAVDVDASRCATIGGLFAISFVRLAENGPDLEFAERFVWHPGQMELVVEFWADEAVHKHWIGEIAPCPCRGG